MKRNWLKSGMLILAASVMTVHVISCGTLIYPERIGQAHPGRIDPAIAILDGVVLLAFLIPGIIAFAVDFSNGAIYIPEQQECQLDLEHGLDGALVVRVAPESLTKEKIEAIILEHTGRPINLDDPGVKISFLDSLQ